MAKNSSVSFIDLKDIKEGLLVLKGGRYRAVVTAEPVNFSLLSSEEQEAVEGAFGSMLMGLSFPLQILCVFLSIQTGVLVTSGHHSYIIRPKAGTS